MLSHSAKAIELEGPLSFLPTDWSPGTNPPLNKRACRNPKRRQLPCLESRSLTVCLSANSRDSTTWQGCATTHINYAFRRGLSEFKRSFVTATFISGLFCVP